MRPHRSEKDEPPRGQNEDQEDPKDSKVVALKKGHKGGLRKSQPPELKEPHAPSNCLVLCMLARPSPLKDRPPGPEEGLTLHKLIEFEGPLVGRLVQGLALLGSGVDL